MPDSNCPPARICELCGDPFATERAYWNHFIIEPEKRKIRQESYTRCLTYDERHALGWCYGVKGWKTWEEMHEKLWDSERQYWSILFDPALLFEDMFPAPKPPEKRPFWKFW